MSRRKLYEGKAKVLFEGPDPGTIIQYFKDDATAFNNQKKAVISGKGVLNNRISEYIMTKLEEIGIETHFIKALNMREQLVKAAEIIPVEIVVRNITAGQLAKRFSVDEGLAFPYPLIEFYLKSDDLGDPLVSEEHIVLFQWADEYELEEIKAIALRINDFLTGLFLGANMKLVDFKLEFGRIYDEEGNAYIIVADEISPDSCRLWDIETGEKLDKDRFRHDLGKVAEAYQEVARRLGIFVDGSMEVVRAEKLTPEKTKKGAAKKKSAKKAGSGKAAAKTPANKNTKKPKTDPKKPKK